MGDLLRFLPLASSLKRRHPAAHVTWAVGSRFRDVVEMSSDVDEVLVIDADPLTPRRRWLPALLKFTPGLRRRSYDVAVDAHSTPLSTMIMALSRTDHRLGIDKPNPLRLRPFPYQALKVEKATSVEMHLSVLRFFEIELEDVVLDVHLDPGTQARRASEELLALRRTEHEPLVVIHHHTNLESKLWEAEKVAELANRIARETGSHVVIVGEDASERLRIIRQRCDPEITFLSGLSLRELAAVLAQADLVIALESGPLHLAAALGRPTIGIFGPSDPIVHAPFGKLHRIVRTGVPCSPCFRGFGIFFTCPLGTKECLTSLQVDDVAHAARDALRDFEADRQGNPP